ncbi:type VI secretion system baseplate subunit TssF/IglH [Lentisphaerota bacterium WC36G]|nr:hypothetical protein LJT99_01240 [Lentisphaerae bacterium WC36]
MENLSLSQKFIDSIAQLKSDTLRHNTDARQHLDSGEVSPKLYDKFVELVAFYNSKTLTEMKNYISLAMLQRMRNLFPYFFSILPNRLLVKVNPQIQLQRPLKIHLGEKISGYSISSVNKNKEELFMENISEAHIMPFDIKDVDFNYDTKSIEIDFKSSEPFFIDCKAFSLWINYNNDINSSIIIYELLLKHYTKASLHVEFSDGEKATYPLLFFFDRRYKAIHPNANVQMLLNSPAFFLFVKVKFPNELLINKKPIKNAKMAIKTTPLITEYEMKKIFDVNIIAVLNIHNEFAKVIEYDATQESYPLIHPKSNSFLPYFIRTVTYTTVDENENMINGKIYPEIFISKHGEKKNNILKDYSDQAEDDKAAEEHGKYNKKYHDCNYHLIYETEVLAKRYRQISFNMPYYIMQAKISVNADWLQLFEINTSNFNLEFYNKQIGSFKLEHLHYQKFCDLNSHINSRNVLALLKLHNCSYFSLDDFKLLLNTLIAPDSVFNFLIYNLIDLNVNKKNKQACAYELIFKETDSSSRCYADILVKGVQRFLNSNLGFTKKIVLSAVFKAVKEEK